MKHKAVAKNTEGQITPQVIKEILAIISQHRQKKYAQVLTSFAYFGDGSQLFDSLVGSTEYRCFEREKLLFIDAIKSISKELSGYRSLQIIDLGVGNGLKWVESYQFLKRQFDVEYTGIDTSANMIDLAKNNFSGQNISYQIDNFMSKANLTRELALHVDARVMSMLGNTICNFIDESNELLLLKEIQNHDKKPCFIIFGLELFSGDSEAILKEYQNELNEQLDFVPLDILGIDKSCGTIEIIFNSNKSQIEEWFHIDNDTTFIPPYHTRQFKLKKGDAILLSVTQKPTEEHLMTKLAKVWDRASISIYRDDGIAIVVVYPLHI